MAGPSSPTLEGTLLGGRYELLEPIGSGGMAAVWLGEDRRLGRPVAVKLLAEALAGDPGFSTRFRREARVAASLTHPASARAFAGRRASPLRSRTRISSASTTSTRMAIGRTW